MFVIVPCGRYGLQSCCDQAEQADGEEEGAVCGGGRASLHTARLQDHSQGHHDQEGGWVGGGLMNEGCG